MAEQIPKEKVPILASIWKLMSLSGRNRYWIFAIIFTIMVATTTEILLSVFSIYFIDSALTGDMGEYSTSFFRIVLTFFVFIPTIYIATLGGGLFSERLLRILREKIASKLSVLPIRYIEERHSGDVLGVLNADLMKTQNMLTTSLAGTLYQILMMIGAAITLLVIHWQLTLASVLISPIMMFIMSKLNKPIAQNTNAMQGAIGETVSIVRDGLGGLLVSKVFNITEALDNQFEEVNQKVVQKGLLLSKFRALSDSNGMIFAPLPYLIVFGYGGYLIIQDEMTFGALFAYMNLLGYLAHPLFTLPPAIANISEACGASQRTFQILERESERTNGESFKPSKEDKSAIQFLNTNFAYDGEPIFNQLNLEVKTGQTAAFVGSSGAGKSTLLKLLLGFYPVENNSVLLFGHDLNTWSLSAVRDHLSFVSQDTFLYPVTISENIACGKDDIDQTQIETAAKMANIHEFIMTLPDGYQTLVGERGARLSGGQRQRLSLARAILKDAPILLLDEPTSALDTESEFLVQSALEKFMVGRTTIVIAHRLSTIRNADVVFVLDKGKIIEQGSHDELIQANGKYQDLYTRQLNQPVLN